MRALPLSLLAAIPWLVAAADQSNIVDDLGRGDLGCCGRTNIQTPRIDALAPAGPRHTPACAGSIVCAPSRCCLVTGLHNGRSRLRDNPPHGGALRTDDATAVEVLKQAGGRAAAIGKWPLGDAGSWGVPNAQAFDYWFGELKQDLAIHCHPESLWEDERAVLLQDLFRVGGIGTGAKSALPNCPTPTPASMP